MIFLLSAISALHVQKNNKNYKTQKPAGLVFYKTGFFEPSLPIMQCNCKMGVLSSNCQNILGNLHALHFCNYKAPIMSLR